MKRRELLVARRGEALLVPPDILIQTVGERKRLLVTVEEGFDFGDATFGLRIAGRLRIRFFGAAAGPGFVTFGGEGSGVGFQAEGRFEGMDEAHGRVRARAGKAASAPHSLGRCRLDSADGARCGEKRHGPALSCARLGTGKGACSAGVERCATARGDRRVPAL